MSESWFGRSEQVPFDLRAAGGEADGAQCHVCEMTAAHLVELSQDGGHTVELGSAVFLCQMCFDLVSGRDMEALTARFTEVSGSEAVRVAERMVSGHVASVPVVQ